MPVAVVQFVTLCALMEFALARVFALVIKDMIKKMAVCLLAIQFALKIVLMDSVHHQKNALAILDTNLVKTQIFVTQFVLRNVSMAIVPHQIIVGAILDLKRTISCSTSVNLTAVRVV